MPAEAWILGSWFVCMAIPLSYMLYVLRRDRARVESFEQDRLARYYSQEEVHARLFGKPSSESPGLKPAALAPVPVRRIRA